MVEEAWQRATSPEQKEQRRAAILEAARELFRDRPIAEISIGEVAQRAGVAKGSVYRYFTTKEEVFLALLVRELDEWFDALALALEGQRAEIAAVAARVVDTLRTRDTLLRLLSRLYSDIEQNISIEAARAFKGWLLVRVGAAGAALEAALPTLARGDGGRVVLRLYALIAGLFPMANPVGPIKEVLAAPEMAALRVELFEELGSSFTAMLVGMAKKKRRSS